MLHFILVSFNLLQVVDAVVLVTNFLSASFHSQSLHLKSSAVSLGVLQGVADEAQSSHVSVVSDVHGPHAYLTSEYPVYSVNFGLKSEI